MSSRAFSTYVASKTPKRYLFATAAASGIKTSNARSCPSSSVHTPRSSTQRTEHRISSSSSSCNTQNLYEVLGVSNNCSAKEIKSAYRMLSKKYHPDYNPSGESTFRTIHEAYSVLVDPDKRRQYDSKFVLPKKSTTSERTHHVCRREFDPNLDITHTIHCSVADLLSGKRKKFLINRRVPCTTCCSAPYHSEKVSDCDKCSGTMYSTVEEIIRVKVEPGMVHGQTILVSGKGDESLIFENATTSVHSFGNLVFNIEQR